METLLKDSIVHVRFSLPISFEHLKPNVDDLEFVLFADIHKLVQTLVEQNDSLAQPLVIFPLLPIEVVLREGIVDAKKLNEIKPGLRRGLQ